MIYVEVDEAGVPTSLRPEGPQQKESSSVVRFIHGCAELPDANGEILGM